MGDRDDFCSGDGRSSQSCLGGDKVAGVKAPCGLRGAMMPASSLCAKTHCSINAQCGGGAKSCMIEDFTTRAVRMVGGVLRLRPMKRGTPAVITAPIAAISPCLIVARAVRWVP